MPPGITAKEVNVDLAGFKASVDKQFASVDKMLYLLVGIGITIVGVGFAFQREIALVEARLDHIEKRLEKLEVNADTSASIQRDAKALQGQILQVLAKIGDSVSSSPIQILPLSEIDKSVIREFFGIDKGPSKFKPKFSLGQFVTGAAPIVDELVAKLPKLSGLSVLRDPDNGSVLLVGSLGRIVGIVEPA